MSGNGGKRAATCAGGSIEPGPVTQEGLAAVCGFNDPIYTAEITGIRFWDAMFDYLRKYGKMHISPEQRMHEIGRPENNNAPC